MLDVGLYAHPQRRGENRVNQVDFIERDDQHRQDAIRTQPIYRLKENYGQSAVSVFAEPVAEEDQCEIATVPANSDRDEHGNYYLHF
jgi:hypothetical protein